MLACMFVKSNQCLADGIKLRDLVENEYTGVDKTAKVKAEDAGIDLAAEDPYMEKVETTQAVETTTTPHPMPKAPQPHVQPDPDSKEKPLIPLSQDSMLFIGLKQELIFIIKTTRAMNDLTFIIRHIHLILIHWGLVLRTRLPL